MRRSLADAQSLITAVESYRRANGQYPHGFEPSALERAIEPDYIRTAPMDGVTYYSDGVNYTLIVRPQMGTGAASLAPLEICNGKVVSWPAPLFDAAFVDAASRYLQEMRRQADITLQQNEGVEEVTAAEPQK